ncbi:MAG: polysaccharide biosynthesis tyrosine autokinase [Longimicrobiales bacterium]
MTDPRLLPARDDRPVPPTGELFSQDGRAADGEFELRDGLAILVRRKWIVLASVAVSLALTFAVLYFEDPIYRAHAMFRIEDTQSAMAGSFDTEVPTFMLAGRLAPDFVLSQLEILHSAQVLGKVVDREGLRLAPLDGNLHAHILADIQILPSIVTDTVVLAFKPDGVRASSGQVPEVRAPYRSPLDLGGLRFTVLKAYEEENELRLAVLPRQRTIETLAQDLRAQPEEGTDVISVDYTSTDPELAMRVVNATVEAFRERNIQAARQLSQRRVAFLQEQMSVYDSLLVDAQGTLSDFRSRERVFSSAEWFAAQQTGLMELDIRREELDADRRMYRSMLGDLQSVEPGEIGNRLQSLVASPDIAMNSVVTELFRQVIYYEAQRDSVLGGPWGAARTNPDVMRLEEQIRNTTGRLEMAVRSHIETLDARVTALDGLQARTSAEIAELPEVEAEEARLVQQVESFKRTVDLLREEYQRASIEEAVEAGQIDVIDMASVPMYPENANRGLKLALGLMLGLILGSGGAFLRESLNTRIRERDEMEQVLSVTSVGVIPRIPVNGRSVPVPVVAKVRGLIGLGGNGDGSPTGGATELVTIAHRGSPHAEAFRSIRTNLLFSDAVQSLRTLVVTSPTPEEGKTTTAANLAVAYAQQGLRVLLLDCDLRRARLHRLLDFPREPGLTDVLLGRATVEEACHTFPVEGMDFLASGAFPPNPSELLGGERMRQALRDFRERYEVVVLDTPPLVAGPDAAILGSMCDGAVLVVRAGHTEREAGQQAVRQLNAVGARIVGAVLNDPDGELPKYSSYYSYQYKYYAEEK